MVLKPYGATAAREHFDREQKYSSNLTVDAHSHLHVQKAADLVQGLFDQQDIPAFKHANHTTTNQNFRFTLSV